MGIKLNNNYLNSLHFADNWAIITIGKWRYGIYDEITLWQVGIIDKCSENKIPW